MKSSKKPVRKAAPKKPAAVKENKYVKYFIAALIIIPLAYLVFYVNIRKNSASGNSADSLSVKNAVQASNEKIKEAEELAKSLPTETNYINLSLAYYNAGMYKECVLAAQNAADINPKSYAAHNNMCSAFNQLSMWEEGIAAGKKALEIVPGDQLATNNLKVSTEGKANQDKILADGEALVKLSPSENNYLNLGNNYFNARKYVLAIKAYEKTLGFNRKNIQAYNNICTAYNELGKWKEAEYYCKEALKIDSSFALSKSALKVAQEQLKNR